MSRSLFALVFTLLLPAVQACNPADPCEVAATVDPALRLGVGENTFKPIDNGAKLPLSWGNQGGQHVWMAWQTDGVATGNKGLGGFEPGPNVTLALWSADGVQVGEGFTQYPMDGNPETAELVGQELFITYWRSAYYDPSTAPPEPDFTELTLRIELADQCGTELTQELLVHADL